jgi:hypothetical protein
MLAHLLLLAALLTPLAVQAGDGTLKHDVKDTAHAIKRTWKDGWHATKKTAKSVGKSAAGAAEKGAHKVKKKLDD